VSPLVLGAAALLVGAIIGSVVIPGSAIFAIPIAVLALIFLGFTEFSRRTQAARQMGDFRDQAKAEKIDFTARDRETQYVPDREPEQPGS
jgi:hypothetical protein